MTNKIEQARLSIEPPVVFETTNLNTEQQSGFRAGYQMAASDPLPLDLSQSTVFAIGDLLACETEQGRDYWLGRIVGRLRYAEELIKAVGGE